MGYSYKQFWYNGIPELTVFRGTGRRFSEGSLVLIAACSVRSNCLLYLVVVSILVLSHPILCPVIREWWAGAYCMWENSRSIFEWASCSLIFNVLKFHE